MHSVSALQLKPDRNEWWHNSSTGYWHTSKRYDEARTYTFDMTDWLNSGESLSSVTQTQKSGPNVTSCTVSGATLTIVMSRAGSMVARVVTSSSRTLEVPLRWESLNRDVVDRYA